MNPNTPEQPPSLQDRFPDMRPVKSVPTLFTLNGFGVSIYGKRDHDVTTNTYIKTRCLCFLFIPVLALDAYRVADAPEGWYFIGKVRLSKFAHTWNWWMCTMVLGLFAAMAVNVYTSSPTHQARKQIAEAGEVLKSGDTIKAAGIYRRVAQGNVMLTEAREGLRQSIDLALKDDSAAKVAAALRILENVPKKLNQPTPLVPDAFKQGLALVGKFRSTDPEGALNIFDEVAKFEPKNEGLASLQVALLKDAVAANPTNVNRMVQLALIYETAGQMTECETLLLPHKDKLGSTDGARILGQMLLNQGKHEDAYGLLFPYVQGQLKQLHIVEKNYTNAVNTAYERALDYLRSGLHDRAFYKKYDAASKPEQAAMVSEFVSKRMESDSNYQHALQQLRDANRIVSVTLDLGVVQLHRAQDLKDAAARKAELEAAEKTFLAIRGVAGETDEYRLFLGQVYYWLGRSEEGKELFNELLTANKRSHRILMSLAETLRNVGETLQARTLAEEAFTAAKKNQEKYQAAALRALLQDDVEDEIAWLEKADPSELWVQISLNGARGGKALQDGNKSAAASFLRRCVDGYAGLQKTSASLNNGGLACLRLYEATGELRDYERGVALLEEAISMAPGDSILLLNVGNTLFSAALMEVVGKSIELPRLGEPANLRMLTHLYSNEAGRARVYKELRDNATFRKSMVHLQKASLLSPKSESLYETELTLQRGFRDLPEIQRLHQRVRNAALDPAERKSDLDEMLGGTKDKEYHDRFLTEINKYDALLKNPLVQQHALTAEYVSALLLSHRQLASGYGVPADPSEIIQQASVLYNAHANSITADTLESAYLFAAHEQLRQSNTEYRDVVARSQRILNPHYLLTLMLERGGSLADAIRRNPNMEKAVEIKTKSQAMFPSLGHIADWALVRNFDSSEAGRLVVVLQSDEVNRAIQEVEWELEPLSGSTVVNHYWTLKLNGEHEKAAAVYKQGIANGLPLPAL